MLHYQLAQTREINSSYETIQTKFLLRECPVLHKQTSPLPAFEAVALSGISELIAWTHSNHILYNFLTGLQAISAPILHFTSTSHHLFTLSKTHFSKESSTIQICFKLIQMWTILTLIKKKSYLTSTKNLNPVLEKEIELSSADIS